MTKQLNKVAEVRVSYRPRISENPIIKTSKDSYEVLKHFFPGETIQLHEQFVVIYLNRSNRVLGVYPSSSGGVTSTVVDVRIILSIALTTLSTSIVLSHNHPSGGLKPSQNDIDITLKIKEAGKYMDITVLDHLILTGQANEYFSFADEGLI